MLKNFNISQTERLSIMKNWLGWQGLQHLKILMQADQQYNTMKK